METPWNWWREASGSQAFEGRDETFERNIGGMMTLVYLLPSGGQGVEHDVRAGQRGEVGAEGELQGKQLLWQAAL